MVWDFPYWFLGLVLVAMGYLDLAFDVPLPAQFILGAAIVVPGGAFSLTAVTQVAEMGRKRRRDGPWLCLFFLALWGGLCLWWGINLLSENWFIPPIECPENTFSSACTPCPPCDRGECDAGVEGSGLCFCDVGWTGELCDGCAAHHKGLDCERCDRQFMEDDLGACTLCRFGYEGPNCGECSPGFLAAEDAFGVRCDQCLPGHWGVACAPCPDCATEDPGGQCRENPLPPATFTSSGLGCSYNHECASGYCRGYCRTDGRLCYENEDCLDECVGRTCGLEFAVSDGTCECSRVGYAGPNCTRCPNFDGINSASICAGHGACAATLSGELGCVCQENWSGDLCGCEGTASRARRIFRSDVQALSGGGILECRSTGAATTVFTGAASACATGTIGRVGWACSRGLSATRARGSFSATGVHLARIWRSRRMRRCARRGVSWTWWRRHRATCPAWAAPATTASRATERASENITNVICTLAWRNF